MARVGPHGVFRGELVIRVDSDEQFAALARGWFSAVRTDLFPDIDRVLAAEPTLSSVTSINQGGPSGPPGGVWVGLTTRRDEFPRSARTVSYSAKAWDKFLDGLSTRPFAARLTAYDLDARGYPNLAGAEAAVHELFDPPDRIHEWVRFDVQVSGMMRDWYDTPGVQATWAEFIGAWAERTKACFGYLADDGGSAGTGLEVATGRAPVDTIPRCAEELRGYSWVTICGRELAERLGGAEALSRNGAFSEVRQLAHGAVFLQATSTYRDYDEAAVQRVFRALAPVLITGRSETDLGSHDRRVVWGVDAADYR